MTGCLMPLKPAVFQKWVIELPINRKVWMAGFIILKYLIVPCFPIIEVAIPDVVILELLY